jgi:hypothetical protein
MPKAFEATPIELIRGSMRQLNNAAGIHLPPVAKGIAALGGVEQAMDALASDEEREALARVLSAFAPSIPAVVACAAAVEATRQAVEVPDPKQ